VEQATRLLVDIGVEAPAAVLAPLLRSAVENALGRTRLDAVDLEGFNEAYQHPFDDNREL
jgi:hypothetical protein